MADNALAQSAHNNIAALGYTRSGPDFTRQTALDFALRAGEPLDLTMTRAAKYHEFLTTKETTNG